MSHERKRYEALASCGHKMRYLYGRTPYSSKINCALCDLEAATVERPVDSGNYVCDDETFPNEATFSNGRVVKIAFREDGRPFLMISPKSEYPKPCGICNGVIQSKDDLDWHGYGNCRDIPESIFRAGDPLQPASEPTEELWEVVKGSESDDWGIRVAGETTGMSVAQMLWEKDAKEIVDLHNSAARSRRKTEAGQ